MDPSSFCRTPPQVLSRRTIGIYTVPHSEFDQFFEKTRHRIGIVPTLSHFCGQTYHMATQKVTTQVLSPKERSVKASVATLALLYGGCVGTEHKRRGQEGELFRVCAAAKSHSSQGNGGLALGGLLFLLLHLRTVLRRKVWECFSFSPLSCTAVPVMNQAMDYTGSKASRILFFVQEQDKEEIELVFLKF